MQVDYSFTGYWDSDIADSLVCMIWPAAVTKSILLGWVLRKSSQLLHKWRDAHESRNQVSEVFYRDSFAMLYSLAMQAFLTGPGAKGSGSESSSYSAAWCARFWLFDRPLCRGLFTLLFWPSVDGVLELILTRLSR